VTWVFVPDQPTDSASAQGPVALMNNISADLARALLRYDSETGQLFWRSRPRSMFKTDRQHQAWNARFAGTEALSSQDHRGRKQGRLLGVTVRAHRVVWLIVNGSWPEVIDHISGDPSDNRICNLRDVDCSENLRNQARPKSNRSGRVGVHFCAKRNRWVAQITVDRKNIPLGRFVSMLDALCARQKAESKFGFHENHGRG